MKDSKFVDFCTAITLLVLSVIVFYVSGDLPKPPVGIGSGDYPQFIAVALFLLAITLAVQSIKNGFPKHEKTADNKPFLRIIILLILIFVYVILLELIGFLVMTPLFLCGSAILYGYSKRKRLVLVSILFTGIIFFLFTNVFYIFLPTFSLF